MAGCANVDIYGNVKPILAEGGNREALFAVLREKSSWRKKLQSAANSDNV